uniref:hypothetical protein n=1 Tax=Cysteiniphilum halobium TaxID=2219059 RepID=UPI001AACD8D7
KLNMALISILSLTACGGGGSSDGGSNSSPTAKTNPNNSKPISDDRSDHSSTAKTTPTKSTPIFGGRKDHSSISTTSPTESTPTFEATAPESIAVGDQFTIDVKMDESQLSFNTQSYPVTLKTDSTIVCDSKKETILDSKPEVKFGCHLSVDSHTDLPQEYKVDLNVENSSTGEQIQSIEKNIKVEPVGIVKLTFGFDNFNLINGNLKCKVYNPYIFKDCDNMGDADKVDKTFKQTLMKSSSLYTISSNNYVKYDDYIKFIIVKKNGQDKYSFLTHYVPLDVTKRISISYSQNLNKFFILGNDKNKDPENHLYACDFDIKRLKTPNACQEIKMDLKEPVATFDILHQKNGNEYIYFINEKNPIDAYTNGSYTIGTVCLLNKDGQLNNCNNLKSQQGYNSIYGLIKYDPVIYARQD